MSADKDQARLKDWEIPAPSTSSRDPWSAPGQRGPLSGPHLASQSSPFGCRVCGTRMMAREAFAYDGEIYCGECKPPGAVSGEKDLPPDYPITRVASGDPEELLQTWWFGRVFKWLRWLWG